MNEENVAIRLKGYIDSTGLTSSQFADQCGIPRPTLSQLLSGRNKKISDVLVGQIHSSFPELSVLWLLFGEGNMLVNKKEDLTGEETNRDNNEDKQSLGEDVRELKDGALTKAVSSPLIHGRTTGLQFNDVEAQLMEKDRIIEELRKELSVLRKSPRKVAQITVYYDDSTFETFYPSSSGYGKSR